METTIMGLYRVVEIPSPAVYCRSVAVSAVNALLSFLLLLRPKADATCICHK